jgi:hypothetical protein
LSSEFSQYNIGQNGNFTSRVALVTYNSNASVIANLTAYNSEKELQSSLLGLKSNASDTVSNLYRYFLFSYIEVAGYRHI